MLGTKYLSELVKPEMLQAGKLNIIKSPTGSGKSYFALTAIPQTLTDATHRLVYLIDWVDLPVATINSNRTDNDQPQPFLFDDIHDFTKLFGRAC